VVVPFNVSCGHCWMCERELFARCETREALIPALLPLVSGDDDPLGTEDLATHKLPLE